MNLPPVDPPLFWHPPCPNGNYQTTGWKCKQYDDSVHLQSKSKMKVSTFLHFSKRWRKGWYISKTPGDPTDVIYVADWSGAKRLSYDVKRGRCHIWKWGLPRFRVWEAGCALDIYTPRQGEVHAAIPCTARQRRGVPSGLTTTVCCAYADRLIKHRRYRSMRFIIAVVGEKREAGALSWTWMNMSSVS